MNKNFRTILCTILAFLVMMPSMLCMAGTGNAVVTVGSVTVDKNSFDGTVTVELSIANNPGIAGLQMSLNYDSGIELIKVDKGSALNGLDITTSKTLKSPVNIGLDGLDSDSSNGVFAVLTFTVPNVENVYSIEADIKPDGMYDFDLNDVPFTVNNGFIKVETKNPDVGEDDEDDEIDDVVCVSVEKVVANKDEMANTVSVELSIKNNPGIAGIQMKVDYSNGIELTQVDKGPALSNLDLTTSKNLTSPVNIGLDGLDEDSTNGVFAVLTFTVPKTVDAYSIEVSIEPDGMYDFDLNNVPFVINNGYISVDTAIPDVDNDSEITPNDIIVTAGKIAGVSSSDNNVMNADFDNDNRITTKDLNAFVTFIRRILELFSK